MHSCAGTTNRVVVHTVTTSLEVAFASASLSLSEAAGETESPGLQLKLCLKNHVFKAATTSDAHHSAAHQSAFAPPTLTRFSPRRRAADFPAARKRATFFFQPLGLSDSNSDRPVRNLTFTVARPSHTLAHMSGFQWLCHSSCVPSLQCKKTTLTAGWRVGG